MGLSSNILLRALPPEMNYVELSQWLERLPKPGPWEAHEVRHEIESVFVATQSAIDIAAGLLDMMRLAAAVQDPRVRENRLRVTRVVDALRRDRSMWEPGPDTCLAIGMCVIGLTGVGKSRSVSRVLNSIPQVVEHEEDAASLTVYLKQVVHLTVHMSGDGTPAAFFIGALMALDSALGTTYWEDAKKGRLGVNSLMVIFMSKLMLHRVLLLVVEEAQERNLDGTRYQALFRGLFLQLLNCGIPVVLIGNPSGIKPLLSSSQLRRRLTQGGEHRLHPVLQWQSPEWRLDLVPTIWMASPFAEPDEVWCTDDELCEYLWRSTGGFKSHLASWRVVAVKIALREGSHRVERSHITRALIHPEYLGNRPLSEAFAERNVTKLREFTDTDAEEYADILLALAAEEAAGASGAREAQACQGTPEQRSGVERESDEIRTSRESPERPVPGDKSRRSTGTVRAPRSKSSTGGAGRSEVPDGLSPDDVRSDAWLGRLPKRADE